MINLYGILISTSILLCIIVARKLADKDREDIWTISFWAVVSGIIGARLYHVISDFELYRNNLVGTLFIWNGGFGIWGGFAGGVLGTALYLIKTKKPVWYWLDILSVVLPLGQAIGRWGNFFNKELYGTITNLPWGITQNSVKYHPLFFYESVLDLLNFSTLLFLYSKTKLKSKRGFFIFLYLLNYSIIRFFMEFFRQGHWVISGLNVSFLIPILLCMTALCCLVKIQRRKI